MRCKLWIQSRLDRCFGNKEWFKMFPASNQVFLAKRGLDHRPVLVKLLSSSETYKGNFRFDRRFLNKYVVKETISSAWSAGNSSLLLSVANKIRGCRKALSKWKKGNALN